MTPSCGHAHNQHFISSFSKVAAKARQKKDILIKNKILFLNNWKKKKKAEILV